MTVRYYSIDRNDDKRNSEQQLEDEAKTLDVVNSVSPLDRRLTVSLRSTRGTSGGESLWICPLLVLPRDKTHESGIPREYARGIEDAPIYVRTLGTNI